MSDSNLANQKEPSSSIAPI